VSFVFSSFAVVYMSRAQFLERRTRRVADVDESLLTPRPCLPSDPCHSGARSQERRPSVGLILSIQLRNARREPGAIDSGTNQEQRTGTFRG
jgi:hypothetical protein